MTCRLINGDCIEEMQKLINDGVKVDLTVTSPPYDDLRNYNETLEWNYDIFTKIADLLYNITKESGVLVWVVSDKVKNGSRTLTSFKQALYFKTIGFNVHDVMIWNKPNPIPQFINNRYRNCFEYMFILSKGKVSTFNGLQESCKTKGTVAKSFKQVSSSDNVERLQKEIITKDTRIRNNVWDIAVGGGVMVILLYFL